MGHTEWRSVRDLGLRFLPLVFLCLRLSAVEILVTADTPYVELIRGAAWNGTGLTGINNTYIFSLSDPDIGVCLYLENNDTAAHTLTLDFLQSGNTAVMSFINPSSNAGRWRRVSGYTEDAGSTGALSGILVGSPLTVTVPGNPGNGTSAGQLPIFVQAKGGARLAIVASGGTGNSSVNFVSVQTHSSSCGQLATGPNTVIGAYLSGTGIVPWTALSATALGQLTAENVGYGNPSVPVAMIVEKGPRWFCQAAAVNTSPTICTRAACGVGCRHVVDCVMLSANSTGATAATVGNYQVQDDPAGVPTILVQYAYGYSAAAALGVTFTAPSHFCGLAIVGGDNKAMAIRATQSGANINIAVEMTGYDVK